MCIKLFYTVVFDSTVCSRERLETAFMSINKTVYRNNHTYICVMEYYVTVKKKSSLYTNKKRYLPYIAEKKKQV